MGALILLVGAALALPRLAPPRPPAIAWEEGRDPTLLFVKFRGEPRWPDLGGATPVRLSESSLKGWWRVRSPEAEALGDALLADPDVVTAYLGQLPTPPPEDIAPPTDDFRDLQTWLDDLPGMGLPEAARWPGGGGENVAIVDVEYGWDPTHEDLAPTTGAEGGGWNSQMYLYHGNSVLGQLVGELNGYGVDGAIPDATPWVVSPFGDDQAYDVAGAIATAAALLSPGDVLLIEQQAWCSRGYCPVESDAAVFDAIAEAVASGIVVVEPGGNGGLDLDDPGFEGWFDRTRNDSGAILVGGGASPYSGFTERAWYPGGSSYGSRVDVQGWYDGIVTATSGEYGSALADLYFPDGDTRQAYTRSFGGTSGASPMIAAVAAAAQSVSIALTGAPWDPLDLRAALVATGWPQAEGELIGPQPDLRRLLRTYFVP